MAIAFYNWMTKVEIGLDADGVTVNIRVFALSDRGDEPVLYSSALLAGCEWSNTYDGMPCLGTGRCVIPIPDFDTAAEIANEIGLPIPQPDPNQCASTQRLYA